MPPSTWLFNAIAPMALNYARRRYRRKVGNALYRRSRRSLSYRGSHLRGTARRRIAATPAPVKRKWARAMGSTAAPSARGRFKKSRYHNQLGLKIGSNACRRYKHEELNTGEFDKQLNAKALVNAEYSDDDTRMNVRTGRLAIVKGVKFRAWFSIKNQAESSNKLNQPLQIRWAILNPADHTTGTVLDVTLGNNFFISDSPGTDDATDFPSTGSCFRYMNRKINQRKYGVVQEGTFILQNPVDSNNSRMDTRSKKLLTLWCPIQKQMKWANTTTGANNRFPNANLYFVWWYCELGDNTSAPKFGTANDVPIELNHETITYFKNPDVLK